VKYRFIGFVPAPLKVPQSTFFTVEHDRSDVTMTLMQQDKGHTLIIFQLRPVHDSFEIIRNTWLQDNHDAVAINVSEVTD
jgi:hypothetical protein